MKYLRLFPTEADYASALAEGIDIPNVSAVDETGKVYTIPRKAWGLTTPADGSTTFAFQGSHDAWENYKGKMGRYLVTEDGTARKLSPSDSTKLEDGTTFDASSGNVLVRLPRLYYMSVNDSVGHTTLWMSEEPFSDHYIDEQWVGAYLGYLSNGKLRSQAGVNPTRSRTISQFWADAQGNGTDWGLADYDQRRMMVMLYLSEFLNLNSQSALGNGMTGVGNNWCTPVQNATTGATATLGDTSGKVDFTASGQSASGACHVSLFGIEDPWGWFWEMIQGCYFGNVNNSAQNGTEAYLYSGNRIPDATELTTKPKTDYRQLVRPTASGYPKTMIGGENFDMILKTTGGGSASYWCDYHNANNTGQLLLWGGRANGGPNCGLVCSSLVEAFSYSFSDSASRLAFYGDMLFRLDGMERSHRFAEDVRIERVYGKTYAVENLAEFSATSETRNGVTLNITGDVINLSGTNTSSSNLGFVLTRNNINLYSGRKYLLYPVIGNVSYGLFVNGSYTNYYGIFSPSNNEVNRYVERRIVPNGVVNESYMKPILVDLTTMFGSGNEPSTLEELNKFINPSLISGSGLISFKPSRIVSSNADNTKHESYDLSWIPELRSAGDVADEYDVKTGKITRKIGMVEFDGTEGWRLIGGHRFYNEVPGMVRANNWALEQNVVSNSYKWMVSFGSDYEGQAMAHQNADIVFNEPSCENVAAWKSHLADLKAQGNPLTVYYELAEPYTEHVGLNGFSYTTFENGHEVVESPVKMIADAKIKEKI